MADPVSSDLIIQNFRDHIARYIIDRDCYGFHAFGKGEFVPRDALSQFWTTGKILDALCRDHKEERIQTDRQKLILDDYLVVFSILVSISRPEYIGIFMSNPTILDDKHLPIQSLPEEWKYDPQLKDVFDEFDKAQWKFCPLTFNRRPYRTHLHPFTIVPISNKRLIGHRTDEEEDDVLVYEADWHQSCLGSLLESSRVVLKTYYMRTKDVIDSLDNEIDMYSNLEQHAFENIIEYFGSFEQEAKLTLMLEHASGGNLAEFWERSRQPVTLKDKVELWDSFFRLLTALEATHDLIPLGDTADDTSKWLLKGTHQDIRPQNILITETRANSFVVKFKLTDFGTGHVRRCRRHGFDGKAAQRRANGMYGPPESVRDNATTTPQDGKSDIWFLGAVASEFLVWSVKGNSHRIRYQRERGIATDRTHLSGGYHDACFHDGYCRLDVVDEIHKSILASLGQDDLITPMVSNFILNHLLVADLEKRSNASQAYSAWKTELNALLPAVRAAQTARKGTKDSYVASILSSPQAFNPNDSNPWLPGPMLAEPIHHHDHDSVPNQNTNNAKHVQFGGLPGIGVAGPSNLHHNFGLGPSRGSIRRGTNDTSVLGTPFEPVLEVSGGQKNLESERPNFSPPFRPAGHGNSRTPTPASKRPSLPRRVTVDDHYGVEEVGEGSTPPTNTGVKIENKTQRLNSLPSPPETPAAKRVNTSLSNHSRIAPFGRSFSTRVPTMSTLNADADKITVDIVYDKITPPEGESRWSLRKKKVDLLAEFPRLGEAVKKLKGLKGREQVFIIDDASSMATHRHEMGRTLRVLARLLKVGGVDPNKLFTVYHTCDTTTVELSKATALEQHVKKHIFSSYACDIHAKLDEIISIILESPIPVSIYVLTNGRWNASPGNPQDLCGVDAVIERILVANKKLTRQSNHVGFQFIRFYRANPDDDVGKERLDYLDNSLPEKFERLEIPKSDIIDTTDWDDDVFKMLLGGVFAEEDNVMSP